MQLLSEYEYKIDWVVGDYWRRLYHSWMFSKAAVSYIECRNYASELFDILSQADRENRTYLWSKFLNIDKKSTS